MLSLIEEKKFTWHSFIEPLVLDADANASRAVFSMSHVSVVVERVVQLLLHQRALSSLNIGALSLFLARYHIACGTIYSTAVAKCN